MRQQLTYCKGRAIRKNLTSRAQYAAQSTECFALRTKSGAGIIVKSEARYVPCSAPADSRQTRSQHVAPSPEYPVLPLDTASECLALRTSCLIERVRSSFFVRS